jgi:TolB-like protein/Tfp pilus assembly protein PilF
MERKLVAILAADVVGFSSLMGADEEGTLQTLQAHRRDFVHPKIAEHHGRIVKLTGDGELVEFASVVDAVRCAVEIQNGMAQRTADEPKERRITYRIGVNLGDVIVDGEDLYGDGVNIATRLEASAEPGGICISDTAYRHLTGKMNIAFQDDGERTLKNIAHPVRVWRWAPDPTSPLTLTSAPLPLPDRPSIAVLPFDNLSGQPEDTYFSDGITEDIITGLARFRSLFVIARNSSFAFRGKTIDMAEIGRRLGVSYLLEGSVRRSGERVRITAQLIDAATGVHLWAERYDRKLDDIFAVQDDVAQTIVSTLAGRIEDARLQQVLHKPTTNLVAYDCWLRGMAYFRGYADDDNQNAYDMFKRAVKLDARYALAHAYHALVWVALHGHASAPAGVLDEALATATHALELDPQESRCHRILSHIWIMRRDFSTAEHHLRRAVDLNPNDADAKVSMGNLLALRGRPEEALIWIDAAMRLNPLYPTWYNVFLGIALYSLRRYEEAAQALHRLSNRGYWSRARLAACYGQLGRTKDAEAEVIAILQQKPDFTIDDFLHRDVLLERTEDRELLRDGLIKAGLPN